MAKDTNQPSLAYDAQSTIAPSAVECLGMTFPNDEARRAYFTEKLREKLKDPAFRKIEGFPIGDDENILTLSDPPYYTACPNPFVADFIASKPKQSGEDAPYDSPPYAADVSEGKQDPICMAHTYHTKVPYRAIARYILHYTQPGDLVLDSFSGTGMTGVAAQFLDHPDKAFVESIERECRSLGSSLPKWGARNTILFDLAPFATFLTRCYNSQLPADAFEESARSLIAASEDDLGWVYTTDTGRVSQPARMNYAVWTDAFFCECGTELTLWQVITDQDKSLALEALSRCRKCKADLAKRTLQKATHTFADEFTGMTITQNKQIMLSIEYAGGSRTHKKKPSAFDFDLIAKIQHKPFSSYCPTQAMMFKDGEWGDMYRSGYHFGVSHAHHFWTRRNLLVLSDLFQRASSHRYSHEMRFVCTSFAVKTGSRMHNIGLKDGRINLAGQAYNTLQLTSLAAERNLFSLASGKVDDLKCVFELPKRLNRVSISTCSSTNLVGVPDSSIDYIFVDPPFGNNIIYSELSFLYECWLRVFTNQAHEAIVSSAQEKKLPDYQSLMLACFQELHRVLKPGRWITIAFHNSKNVIWNAIQEALGQAGLVIADVRIIDKGQGTFKQMTTQGAVDKDLAITAYRPNTQLEEQFSLTAGKLDGVWAFTRGHLNQLPVLVSKSGVAEQIAERRKYLLYDRMVAFHVQHGVTIPISSSEYYVGLAERYPEREGMYFLPDQVAEYDHKRLQCSEMEQLELFVSDEKSAIQWVRGRLAERAMSYQELQPIYMQEAQRAWGQYEQPMELRTILVQNFIEDGDGSWRVPDPKKEADLEHLRDKALLKEFQQSADTKGKLKVVRSEAIRAGFKDCWQRQDYVTIIQMAKRVPNAVIQEDPALLMYLDNALMRTGE
jgi:DNA modification methylase